jgi:flagellar basal-body rod protein FlgB
MIDKLGDSLNFSKEVLNLRQERQKVLASNIANADTPNYKARDFDFSSELSKAVKNGRTGTSSIKLDTTSEAHLSGSRQGGSSSVHSLNYRVPAQPSMDGNTVEMETERAQFADNSVRQQASLTFLNGYIRGLKSAMRPE